jgi:uncharacterized glyoxalase superfamily protein PhnB
MRKIHRIGAVTIIALASLAATGQKPVTKETKTMINRSTPIFHVRSVEPSIKFWTERFGFKVTIEVPEADHIGFAALENGSVELMFQTYQGMKTDPSNPLAGEVEKGPSFIFMEVGDINSVIEKLKGAEIVQGLHETFYGSKEVTAKEPGGHFVIFSQLPTR